MNSMKLGFVLLEVNVYWW